jgi:hypothetical protein
VSWFSKDEKALIGEMDQTIAAMRPRIEEARKAGNEKAARNLTEYVEVQVAERGRIASRHNAN